MFAAALMPASVSGQTSTDGLAPLPGLLADTTLECGARASQLELLSHTVSTPLSGGPEVTQYKFFNPGTGQLCGAALDPGGSLVDVGALVRAQAAAVDERLGRLAPRLATMLSTAQPFEEIEVGFWLRSEPAPAVARSQSVPEDEAEALARTQEEAVTTVGRLRERAARATRPFAETLSTRGYQVEYVAPLSPAIFARVPAHGLRELAADPRVDRVYFTGDRVADMQNTAIATTGAAKVHTGKAAITGVGVTTGVVECCASLAEEDGTDLDAENNGYLARVHELRAGACGNPAHPTAVSGIIASTHPVLTGAAPNSRIVFDSGCFGLESEIAAAISNVAAKVDGPTNHSYGVTAGAQPCPTADELGGMMVRLLDDISRNLRNSQYVAAGNNGNNSCVNSPGTAWNVITVGAFDDKNSNSWSGDTMATFSNSADPESTNGDRQKPEVVAPGVSITGLLPSSTGGIPTGLIGSGTSFAAPIYVGAASLAAQRKPALLGWPEAEKAVMLASACHNIEGSQVNSDLDGAGAPDFLETDALLAANRFSMGTVENGNGLAVTQAFSGVASGNEVRVALAWANNPAYDLYSNQPSQDLDLLLFRPDGSLAASSSSLDNNYEVLEVVADQAGTWTIEVHRFRTDDPDGFTYYGLAWHKYAPSACTAP